MKTKLCILSCVLCVKRRCFPSVWWTNQEKKMHYFFFGKLRPSPPAMSVSLIWSWFLPVFLLSPVAVASKDDDAVETFMLDPAMVPMVTWLRLLLDSWWTVVVLLCWWWLFVVVGFAFVDMEGPRLLSLESSFVTESDSLLRSAEFDEETILKLY